MSAVLLAAQLWIVGQWTLAASGGRATAVADFLRLLPRALGERGVGTVTGLCVILAVSAAGAAFFAQSHALGARRLLARGLLVTNGVLLVWYAFTMM